MKRPLVHVIGAGVAGLSAAYRLATSGRCDVVVHEARAYPGGRRRSFYDDAFGAAVDTGNFPLLSGWRSTLALIDAVDARSEWRTDEAPGVAFADLAKGKQWRLTPNAGRIPWWLLLTARRGPDLTPADYWPARRLLSARPEATVAVFAPKESPALDLLWRPLTLAALNGEPEAVSARLAGAALLEIVTAGGGGLRLMAPVAGIGSALIEPLARAIERAGVTLRFGRRVVGLVPEGARAAALEFEHDRVLLGPRDGVILAASWETAAGLVPGVTTPSGASMSLTAHFAMPPPADAPLALGVINGPFHWLFTYGDRVSVTVKDAAVQMNKPREIVAAECWRAVAALTGLSDVLPPWRVVRSRHAGFVSTPAEAARRPAGNKTQYANVFVAGGYVAPSASATIESAVRSGEAAAQAFLTGQEKKVTAAMGTLRQKV